MATGLAARCTSCSTVFRVVADQLRVSEGWVRCGRCAQVFNALETLVDLETGLARRISWLGQLETGADGQPAPLDVAQPAPRPRADDAAAGRPSTAPAQAAVRAAWAAPASVAAPVATQASAPVSAPTPGWASAPIPGPAAAAAANPAPAPVLAPATPGPVDPGAFASTHGPEPTALLEPGERPGPDGAGPDPADAPQPEPDITGAAQAGAITEPPSFVRQADRAAFWRRTPVRMLGSTLALGLAVLLAGQLAHTWRDRLAAQVPALAPALAHACTWLGCTLEPARAPEALSVESSGLLRIDNSALYKLQVALRNRAPYPVAVPALELTLTDQRGERVARRVLTLAELGAREATIPPNGEIQLQSTLKSVLTDNGQAVVLAGYTVELFYP